MDLVNKHGRMEHDILDNGKIIGLADMGFFIMWMEIFMKVIGKMIKLKDMVCICIRTAAVMKGTGTRIYIMVLDVRLGLMVVSMKENMLMESRVVQGNTSGQMEVLMMDTGKTIKWKVSESSLGMMEDIMKENGKII